MEQKPEYYLEHKNIKHDDGWSHAWLGAQQLGSVTWVQVLEYVCECNEYEHKNTGTWDNHLFRSNPNLVLGSSVKSAAGEDPVPGIEAEN